jgi:hypothetical protein
MLLKLTLHLNGMCVVSSQWSQKEKEKDPFHWCLQSCFCYSPWSPLHHTSDKKNCFRWASLLLWNLPLFLFTSKEAGWGFWMFLNKYVHTHQVLINFFCCCCSCQTPNCVPIKFPMCSHLPTWPLSKGWTLISYIYLCVCVCEPKEALLLIYILSANFYFGECPKFQDFLLWWANQNGSLGTFFFFFKFKKRKIYKELWYAPHNYSMEITTSTHGKYLIYT